MCPVTRLYVRTDDCKTLQCILSTLFSSNHRRAKHPKLSNYVYARGLVYYWSTYQPYMVQNLGCFGSDVFDVLYFQAQSKAVCDPKQDPLAFSAPRSVTTDLTPQNDLNVCGYLSKTNRRVQEMRSRTLQNAPKRAKPISTSTAICPKRAATPVFGMQIVRTAINQEGVES